MLQIAEEKLLTYHQRASFSRVFLGCCIGFLLGNRFLPLYLRQNQHEVAHNPCIEDEIMLQKWRELNSDFYKLKKQFSVIHQKSAFYIGILSAEKNLQSRVATAFATWAKSTEAHIEVFTKNNGTINFQHRYVFGELGNGIRAIQLPGVKDTVYPPQKKCFSMMKFMYDFYINKFDWFVRLDDDAFVNIKKLRKFLARVNASKPWYIGSPGFGRDEGDKISAGENYCMGGPGIVISRGLLRLLGPKLGECLHSLLTEHEDIELGRCVAKVADVKCTMAWETRDLFYQNYDDGINSRNIRSISNKALDKSLTFHANKDSAYQINLHVKNLQRSIAKRQQKIMKLSAEIKDMEKKTLGQANGLRGHVVWSSLLNDRLYKADLGEPNREMRTGMKSNFLQTAEAAASMIKSVIAEKQSKLQSVTVMQSYQVIDPATSIDTVSHLMCTFSNLDQSQKERENSLVVRTRRFFSNSSFWGEDGDLASKAPQAVGLEQDLSDNGYDCNEPNVAKVNFIMALSGRANNFIRFLINFEETFLSRDRHVNLIISYFPPTKSSESYGDGGEALYDVDAIDTGRQTINDENFITENLQRLQSKYASSRIQVVFVGGGAAFSRGLGLQSAASEILNENEIVFFCDVDLVFSPEILLHIRRNTIQGKQVYYPVFFSQYDPQVFTYSHWNPKTHFRFEEDDGFWRGFSYGMVSMYKSDFDKTGGFDLSIKGWGLEDVFLVNAIIERGYAVFKSNEPAQVHVYHDKYCDPTLTEKQVESCKKSRASHFGSRQQLYKLWKKKNLQLIHSQRL